MHRLFHADSSQELSRYHVNHFDTCFADPPDNIGLEYDGFDDNMADYAGWTEDALIGLLDVAKYVWWSFNPKHTVMMGGICHKHRRRWTVRPCVQMFTFGTNRQSDLVPAHRPLWRISQQSPGGDYPLFPDAIRIESWRQKNGDKRASPKGKVPDDVFDFPRVVGNSKQKRKWHKTQLHEGLVERCLKLTTPPGGRVLDPFAGTATVLRVAQRCGFDSDSYEISKTYYEHIKEENHDYLTLDSAL